jgi:hypothetical protein
MSKYEAAALQTGDQVFNGSRKAVVVAHVNNQISLQWADAEAWEVLPYSSERWRHLTVDYK